MELEQAIESIWECAQQGIYYPAEWKGKFTLDDAYRVQLGILQRWMDEGERQAGWKVGLTAKAMQQQQRVHEPVFGFLLGSGDVPSGTIFQFEDLIQPAFENELCLTIRDTLKGPGITAEEARAAIGSVAPALEVPERRGDFAADFACTIADNAQAKYFVTGPASPLPADFSLGRTTVRVYINGESVDQAEGTVVMDSGPEESIVWLANKLAEFGLRLEAGMRVMSGSFTKQYALAQGDHIEARFDPFGSVEAEFQ